MDETVQMKSEPEKATDALSALEEVETHLKSISTSFHASFEAELTKLKTELTKLI